MEPFKSESIIDFFDRYKTDKDCLEYLASIKWRDGFTCVKCHHIESPTANTLFHKVKFGVRKAFTIVFEMSAATKSVSSSQMARR
ncbi:MAG: hypothetical protein ACI83H_002846, partial [Glaciecola sp.]